MIVQAFEQPRGGRVAEMAPSEARRILMPDCRLPPLVPPDDLDSDLYFPLICLLTCGDNVLREMRGVGAPFTVGHEPPEPGGAAAPLGARSFLGV